MMRERTMAVRGTAMYVRDTGQGEPVLLLHGGGPGTSSEGWRTVQTLLGNHHAVYAPDFPGFGRSGPMPPPGGDPAAFAELALALMDALGLERVAVIGHSMGAQVATRMALAQPDRFSHLVVAAPGGRFFGVPGVQPGIAAIGDFLADPTAARMRTVVELLNGRLDDLEQEVRNRMERVTSGDRLAQLQAMMGRRQGGGGATPEPMLAGLKRLPMPTMLVWGARERFTPAEHAKLIHAALPDGTSFVEIAGAGHTMQHDSPEELAAIIASFLDG
jgi:2-hydroxy-6-oxonona-2,4-dienedioate hydrolase/4,5:9,10-diseco-3-hydroxy-5,9,17-trioxoandrosta-1(10),2-diene-4-oate hydrolase